MRSQSDAGEILSVFVSRYQGLLTYLVFSVEMITLSVMNVSDVQVFILSDPQKVFRAYSSTGA